VEVGCKHELELSLFGPEVFSCEGFLLASWVAPCGRSVGLPEFESPSTVVLELEWVFFDFFFFFFSFSSSTLEVPSGGF
jgi:hypothetical protein